MLFRCELLHSVCISLLLSWLREKLQCHESWHVASLVKEAKYLACRQAQPKICFGIKEALTWVQLPVTIRGKSF
jgi:hypothetical protein